MSVIGRRDCGYNFRRGWWCSRVPGHVGPCALRPRWWNLRAHAALLWPGRWDE